MVEGRSGEIITFFDLLVGDAGGLCVTGLIVSLIDGRNVFAVKNKRCLGLVRSS